MIQNARLKKNQQLRLTDGRTITVTDKLGEGGQGIVYKVRIDSTGAEKALKWYFLTKLKEPRKFYNHLQSNIDNGAPSNSFIWAEELTEYIDGEPFGYIMDIYPRGYEEFTKYLMARARFSSVKAMVDAALNIVVAFKDLHNKGYNYQDLNDGNFSINPQNGKVLICDNDNVMGHGESSGVLGKARYMAPEVVRGEKTPDKLTDRFSLAVILFMLLVGDHPLEGQKTNVSALTNKNDRKFFGSEPVFMFDATDHSNAPILGLHQNAIAMWNCFPSYIQKAFQRSFSQESLLQCKNRLLEQEWFHLLVRLKSSIVKSPYSGSEMFLECDRAMACPDTKKSVKPVGYLRFDKRTNTEIDIPIFAGVTLYEYHMNSNSEDFVTESAGIEEKSGKFGLRNKSNHRWSISTPSGKNASKQNGEATALGNGFQIDFGNGNIATVV